VDFPAVTCPKQEFPVLVDGKTLIATANYIPERTTEGGCDSKNKISFEQSGKIKWKLMDSLVHHFTGNSEGLGAHTSVNKISIIEIADDVSQMVPVRGRNLIECAKVPRLVVLRLR
jgi:hypothetical protein